MWKQDVGGWATNGSANRRTAAATPQAAKGSLEGAAAAFGFGGRAPSPPLAGSRPKSPLLLGRSSPMRTPSALEAGGSSASPSSLSAAGNARGRPVSGGSFLPKSWLPKDTPTGAAAPNVKTPVAAVAAPLPQPRMPRVVFADKIDDRPLPTSSSSSGAENILSLPSLRARSRGGQSAAAAASKAEPTSLSTSIEAAIVAPTSTKSKWVTIFGGTPGEFHHALHYLSARCGPIRRVVWPAASANCNWLHIQFIDTVAAAAAVDNGVVRITLPTIGLFEAGDAGRTRALVRSAAASSLAARFAVQWCEDYGMIERCRQEDIAEANAQRLICDIGDAPPEEDDDEENVERGGPSDVIGGQGRGGGIMFPAASRGNAALFANAGGEDGTNRPLTAADRLARLADASRRFASLSDASAALLTSGAAVNRSYPASFSANAMPLGGGASYRATRSGLYLSTQAPTQAEARNAAVFVPMASNPRYKTAAEIWLPTDVPLAARVADCVAAIALWPLEVFLGLWCPAETTVVSGAAAADVGAAGSRATIPPDGGSGGFLASLPIFSFLLGSSYDNDETSAAGPAESQQQHYRRRVALRSALHSTSHDAATGDVRTVIRPLPFFFDYGRLAALALVLAVLLIAYYTLLGPFVDAILEAIAGLVSFVFGTLGLLFGGGGSADGAYGGGAAPYSGGRAGGRRGGQAAPQWEYLYETNYNNDNNRNDYYSF